MGPESEHPDELPSDHGGDAGEHSHEPGGDADESSADLTADLGLDASRLLGARRYGVRQHVLATHLPGADRVVRPARLGQAGVGHTRGGPARPHGRAHIQQVRLAPRQADPRARGRPTVSRRAPSSRHVGRQLVQLCDVGHRHGDSQHRPPTGAADLGHHRVGRHQATADATGHSRAGGERQRVSRALAWGQRLIFASACVAMLEFDDHMRNRRGKDFVLSEAAWDLIVKET